VSRDSDKQRGRCGTGTGALRLMGWSLVLGCGLSAVACAPSLGQPTTRDLLLARQKLPDLTFQELKDGREAYIRVCAGCHHLRQPTERNAEQWPEVIAQMSGLTPIDSADAARIERYLVAMSLSGPMRSTELPRSPGL